MSVMAELLRPSRYARFVEVMRHEGFATALRRAWTRLRLLAAGHVPGVVAESGNLTPPGAYAFSGVWRDLARKDAFHLSAAPAHLSRTRLVGLIGDLNLPQCRKYRVEQLDEIWAQAGYGYRFAHYEDLHRCQDILQQATHVVFYRVPQCSLTTMYLYEARRLRLPVAYDIDDPLFSVSAYETYGNMGALDPGLRDHFSAQAPRYFDVMAAVDLLVFSTPGLVAHAEQMLPRPAVLRRNFADRATLAAGAEAASRAARGGGLTLAVASGSDGHDADLAVARPAIERFLAGDSTRRLMVLGRLDAGAFDRAVQGQITAHPFTGYAAYLGHLARADLALAPLVEDPFNACKSGVRVIDAAAAGVPSLVSEVGDLPTLVDHGATGWIAGAEDWDAALEFAAGEESALPAMGRAARSAIEAKWAAGTELPVVEPAFIDWVRG